MAAALNATCKSHDQFASTRWSVVVAAGDAAATSARALDALSELCRTYWRPLYFFLRREGLSTEDAQDLTQDFFAELVQERFCAHADREKGRFRCFLLGALKHFLADARDREQAQKRGGGQVRVPLREEVISAAEVQLESTNASATTLYEREWAAVLLAQTLQRLASECELEGKKTLFRSLRPYLVVLEEDGSVPYAELSRRLSRKETTLRSDLARLRKRYRAILREEVGETVATPAEVDDELRYLCQVLAHA